jgi:outer membrane protein TolC
VLYDGGLRYADARAADAARDVVALELAALQRRAGLEVRTALVELRTANSRAELAAQELDVARDNAREVEARFEVGLGNALERADANQTVFDAEAGLARARLALRAAEVALLRAAGGFPMGGPS